MRAKAAVVSLFCFPYFPHPFCFGVFCNSSSFYYFTDWNELSEGMMDSQKQRAYSIVNVIQDASFFW